MPLDVRDTAAILGILAVTVRNSAEGTVQKNMGIAKAYARHNPATPESLLSAPVIVVSWLSDPEVVRIKVEFCDELLPRCTNVRKQRLEPEVLITMAEEVEESNGSPVVVFIFKDWLLMVTNLKTVLDA